MAKNLSQDEFLRNLSLSGLLFEDELSQLVEASPLARGADGARLAQSLIDSGRLTPFQADAVCDGRTADLVIGNYQVLDRLGAGGMGTVYKARHQRMKRVVAIKVLSRDVAKSPMFVERFQREVEAVARLSHPNIVIAHDADEAEVGHYLVMEFVNGRDLATEVEKRGPLPWVEARDCVLQSARAMDYAHNQGVIHRDIKPANLLRDVHGLVKVTDLGLARFNDQIGRASDPRSALTQAGTIMGTVDYMSPEQALGITDIDHRTDIYSLGCTLYFLLTGEPPYHGPSFMAILLQHREGPIPSLLANRGDVPPALDQVFQRMVAKKPDDRYATMAEVVLALEALATGESGTRGQPPFPVEQPQGASGQRLDATLVASRTAPVHVPAPNQTIDLAPGTATNPGCATVLLVEPSRVQAMIIRKFLQDIGFQDIQTASSGQKALQLASTTPLQLVISAMHLADMTGMQLVQKIRAQAAAAPPGFVLITGQSDAAEANLQGQVGGAVLLLKPFDLEHLAQALAAAVGEQSAGNQTPAAQALANLRVLIVDDSAAARLHVKSVLTGLGLTQFVEAADGARAVAVVTADRFDLIVTDYNMPYMDGLGLLGYLKQNPATAAVPIIMVTTEQDPAKLAAVRRLGVTAICDKSFPAETVRMIIDQMLSKP